MDILGIDLGGVVIDRVNDGTDTSFFGDNYLETTAVPGAIKAIRKLGDSRFGDNIWIVSKCGPRIQTRSLDWLEHHRFYERTGIRSDRVVFCRERVQKAPICWELGITDFIDDRPDTLIPMRMIVDGRFLFNPRTKDLRQHLPQMNGEIIVRNWQQVLQQLVC